MKKTTALLISALTGCSGGGSNNPTPPASTYYNPDGGWAVSNQSEQFGALPNPFFIPTRPSTNNMMYTIPSSPLSVGKTITLNYNLIGSGTFWVADPKDIPPATISLFIWEKGDNLTGAGQYEYYRWFCHSGNLAFGNNQTASCKIDPTVWGSVFGKLGTANPGAFNQAISNPFAIGFCFGGQYFDCHGVGMATGYGQFQINQMTIQ